METVDFCLYIALLTFLLGSMTLQHIQNARLAKACQEETNTTFRLLMQIMVMCTAMQHDLSRVADKYAGVEPNGTHVKNTWTVVRTSETETEDADASEESEAQA